jgi:hypothetical protein
MDGAHPRIFPSDRALEGRRGVSDQGVTDRRPSGHECDFVAVAGVACSGGGDLGGRPITGKPKKDKDDGGERHGERDEGVSIDQGEGKPSDDRKYSRTTGEDDGDAKVNYPAYTLKSNGYTTYTGDHMTMTMSVGGCTQDRVAKEVRENVLGANVFDLVPVKDFKGDEKYEKANFSFFTRSFSHKRGINFSADKPLPANVLPAAAGRYKALDAGPMSFTAKVTSDRNLPNMPGHKLDTAKHLPAFLAVREFNVTVKITKLAESGGQVMIQLETTIAEDIGRSLYTYFPIGRQTIYTIDTDEQDLISLETLGWANGEDSHQQEETRLTHVVCGKVVAGKVEKSCP